MSDVPIILPKKIVEAERKNPKMLVLYGKPKVGKTTILSKLDNCLVIDLEEGSDFVDALKIKANSLQELYSIGEQIKKEGKPYKYVAIDTITKLEDFCEDAATKMYKALPLGKNFTGKSVLELPKGGGYLYLRTVYKQWFDYIGTLSDNVILIGHSRDSVIDKNGTEVSVSDLDLTGKIKGITCQKADAVGHLSRIGDNLIVSFKHQGQIECGGRCEHLIGQEFEFDWSKIYI